MADVGIYCKFANITARVGTRASAVSNVVAWTDVIVLDVENMINVMTRKNWSDGYAALDVDVKYLLMDAASCMCAMYVIQYDMSGMPSREAETRLDFLRDSFYRDVGLLKDINMQTFMDEA